MSNALTILLSFLNFAPSLKTKLGALAAFGLAFVAAWNDLLPQFGYGPCPVGAAELTAAATAVATCATDWTIHLPASINAAVLALIGIGAANAPANRLVAEKSVQETKTLVIPKPTVAV